MPPMKLPKGAIKPRPAVLKMAPYSPPTGGRADKLLPGVHHAGSVFVGPYSPEAAGDYASGPNHVLPTSGAARQRGGLAVTDYLKVISVQELTQPALRKLAPLHHHAGPRRRPGSPRPKRGGSPMSALNLVYSCLLSGIPLAPSEGSLDPPLSPRSFCLVSSRVRTPRLRASASKSPFRIYRVSALKVLLPSERPCPQ